MSSACRSQVRQLELDRARRIYGRAIAECQKAWVTMVTTCYNMSEHVTTTNQTFWRSAHLFGSDSSDSTFSWLTDMFFYVDVIGSAKGFGRLSSWLPPFFCCFSNQHLPLLQFFVWSWLYCWPDRREFSWTTPTWRCAWATSTDAVTCLQRPSVRQSVSPLNWEESKFWW